MKSRHSSLCFRIGSTIAAFVALLVLGAVASGSACGQEAEHAFLGPKKCKSCHMKQYKSWSKTKMSQAFEILKPGQRAEAKTAAGYDPDKDYSTDEACVPCHVTGWGKAGGFVSIEETPLLAGVTCESCHGAGEGFLAKGFMTLKNKEFKRADVVSAGLVIPDATTCTSQCHNEKNPFNKPFDWETRKAQGTHEHFPLKYQHQ